MSPSIPNRSPKIMQNQKTKSKPTTPEQPTDEGLDETPCSRSSECPGMTHYAGCACHEKGWENKWKCAVEMAARAELERDQLAGYLCRIKLPLPVQFAAKLAGQFPGENIRMKDEGGYLCIFDSTNVTTQAPL